jgi:hypothetical protein
MSQLQTNLAQAVQLTKAMIDLVDDGAWDELPKLQMKRDELINQVLPVTSMSADEQDTLVQLHQLNQKLESLCRDSRHSVMVQLKNLNSNKKAVSAYQEK